MSVLGTANVVNLASTGATPGALPIGADVPDGTLLAVILIRFDGNTDGVSIVSLAASFGAVTILGQTTGLDSNCALAYVVVSSTGAGKTITPVFNSGTFFDRRIFGIVFLDEVDVSEQSAWLRDFDVQWSNGVATATVDTDVGDIVLSGLGNYVQDPPEPADTTTLIAPIGGVDIRHRVVSLDESVDGTASFSSGDSYGSASAISIILSADTPVDEEVDFDAVAAAASIFAGTAALQNALSAAGSAANTFGVVATAKPALSAAGTSTASLAPTSTAKVATTGVGSAAAILADHESVAASYAAAGSAGATLSPLAAAILAFSASGSAQHAVIIAAGIAITQSASAGASFQNIFQANVGLSAAGSASASITGVIMAALGFVASGNATSTPANLEQASAAFTAAGTGNAVLDAVAVATAALVAGLNADEVWAIQCAALIAQLESGAALATFTADTEDTETAIFIASTSSAATFAGALDVIASFAGSASAGATLLGTLTAILQLSASGSAQAQFASLTGAVPVSFLATGNAAATLASIAIIQAAFSANGNTAASLGAAASIVQSIVAAVAAGANFSNDIVDIHEQEISAAATAVEAFAVAAIVTAALNANLVGVNVFGATCAVHASLVAAANATSIFSPFTGNKGLIYLSAVSLRAAIAAAVALRPALQIASADIRPAIEVTTTIH